MTTDTKLPHCPRCGHEPNYTTVSMHAWCAGCGFETSEESLTGGTEAWTRAVRAELARQALELRAHGVLRTSLPTYSERPVHNPVTLMQAMAVVMLDYRALCASPLSVSVEEVRDA